MSTARKTAQLEGICRTSRGIDRASAGNLQWITVALSTLLEHLYDHDNREAFISLCIASRAISRRWTIGRGMLRSIQTTARQLNIMLPAETSALFTELDDRWNSTSAESSSNLQPNFAMHQAAARTNKDDEMELGRSLEQWDVGS